MKHDLKEYPGHKVAKIADLGRLADGPADHRDARRRSLGVHSDQRDLDHRRPDLSAARPVLRGRASGHRRRHQRLARRRQGPDPGHEEVAGGLRLDLAAFRELEAFAQLGTELDKATQPQLDRGYRMVELLKQPQFKPMHVVDQVMSIYAGTNPRRRRTRTPASRR